jgi:hypothetical protein
MVEILDTVNLMLIKDPFYNPVSRSQHPESDFSNNTKAGLKSLAIKNKNYNSKR